MDKKDYYEKVLHSVTSLTNLTVEDILNGRRTDEVVDARWIVAKILSDQGFHSATISQLMRMSQRNVSHIITMFDDRLGQHDFLFQETYKSACKIAGNINEN